MFKNFSIRNIYFQDLIEDFLVSAVAAILGIRMFLRLTGYPQIGSDSMHISHMLWGGLLLFLAIFILLTFLNVQTKHVAAILGGLGFGAFIDELGKFITRDNNYFYEPAFAVIYCVFISIYIIQRIISRKSFTPKEYLVNSLELIKEAVINDLDSEEKKRALEFLKKADPNDAITQNLETLYSSLDTIPPPKPHIWIWIYGQFKHLYKRLIATPYFNTGLIIFFVAKSVISSFEAFGLFLSAYRIYVSPSVSVLDQYNSVSDLAYLLAANIAGLLVIAGVVTLRRNRLEAFRWFKRSLLVSILLTQVFVFYRDQLSAFIGLVFNIVLLLTFNYMLTEERANKP